MNGAFAMHVLRVAIKKASMVLSSNRTVVEICPGFRCDLKSCLEASGVDIGKGDKPVLGQALGDV